MKDKVMAQIFIEFVVPDIVYGEYEEIVRDFEKKLSALHGLTFDSYQKREFWTDEIPF